MTALHTVLGSSASLNFHFYPGGSPPCSEGANGDFGQGILNVHVGTPPLAYTYYAFDAYDRTGAYAGQIGWQVAPDGSVHNLDAASVVDHTVGAQPPPVSSGVWTFRNAQSSDSQELAGMSADSLTVAYGQDCLGFAGAVIGMTIDVYTGGAGPANCKKNDLKRGGNQCDKSVGGSTDRTPAMALYCAHAMLASLNIEDTPIRYSPPRGSPINFTVTYNQRENQQPATFTYSNLGRKWTFNWLSYVKDDPNNASANALVYVPGGGAETYSGFNSGSQSYLPDPQSHAVLVRSSFNMYEKRFPDGSKQIFNLSDGASLYPRKIFMTQTIDPAGNSVTVSYDSSFRVTAITDSLGQVTTVSYELPDDPLKITRVTEPFPQGRFAAFAYTNGQLTMITDEIGIQSRFTYATGSDSIDSLVTPYGTTTFVSGQSGANRWIEMTDPIGAKERVEYRDNAPGISATDPAGTVPAGFTNSGLDVADTFYWDKKATQMYPPVNGVYDYTKARIIHWAYNSDRSVSGIAASEKAPLESRVWYSYAGQSDTNHVGPSANPSQVARVLDDGTTQLWQYQYNSIGKMTKSTDPVGRGISYSYDLNNIDLLTVRQTTGSNNELLRTVTYNAQHEPLTDTDAAGQTTNYGYNAYGQVVTVENAKGEVTTYTYGDGNSVPNGYLASITSPRFNGSSAVTNFTYDSANRVRTVTSNPDNYTVTTDYDNLDRPTQITYPDGTNQQFQYTQDFGNGTQTILNLTKTIDRRGRTTTRHYNVNRQMDSITDPLGRITQYGWCTCGSLTSITDPKGNITTFVRDLQSRVAQKIFADTSSINYTYEASTSRLKSAIDAKGQVTNYQYYIDNDLMQISYTNAAGQPLSLPTSSVSYTYDPNYNRVSTMTDGSGVTSYSYYPITAPPALGAGRLQAIDGPLANDTITYTYDELEREASHSVNGVVSSQIYDALGRVTSATNPLGTFANTYVSVTPRLQNVQLPNGVKTAFSYFDNLGDDRLKTIQDISAKNANISKFDYTYDPEGEITTFQKQSDTSHPTLAAFTQDLADQLTSDVVKDTVKNTMLSSYTYAYDFAGNRTSDSKTAYSVNNLNQITKTGYTYDANGNLTGNGTRTFEWDAADRLSAINNGNARSEFSYDGLDRFVRIVEKTRGKLSSDTRYIWCGNQICESRDGTTGTVLTQFYPQGQINLPTRSKAQKLYATYDRLGSLRELLDTSGAVQARYDYDPYGVPTKVSGKASSSIEYAGYFYHANSGLYFTLHRAYDPTIGRWLSRDPIGEEGGVNLFGYVSNNPINLIDPLGLWWYWGNWGGPNWVSGHVRSESDPIPNPGDPDYRAPIDKMDALFEKHDRNLNQAHNLVKCGNETTNQFEQRRQQAEQKADADLARGLKNLPWYYHVTVLRFWAEPAEAAFRWGPHKHGYGN